MFYKKTLLIIDLSRFMAVSDKEEHAAYALNKAVIMDSIEQSLVLKFLEVLTTVDKGTLTAVICYTMIYISIYIYITTVIFFHSCRAVSSSQ